MGQFSATTRLRAVDGASVWGPWLYLDPSATQIDLVYTNGAHESGANSNVLSRLYYSADDIGTSPTQQGAQQGPWGLPYTAQTWSWSTAGIPSGSYVAAFLGNNTTPDINSADVTYFDDVDYCSYGTEIQGGAPSYLQVTMDLALAVTSYVKSSWFMAGVSFILGRYLNVGALCGAARPAPVTITAADWINAFNPFFNPYLADAQEKFFQWFQWAAWPYLCQCTGGSPAPHAYPNYSQPAPAGTPQPPLAAYTCDTSDICTQLQELTLAVYGLTQRQSAIGQLVTLIQRQHVPFATVYGALHSGLAGAGTFAVQGILGLAVSVVASPGYLSADMETPAETYRFGDLTLGTVDGYLRKVWLTKSPQLIFPIEGNLTVVAYDLRAGVTIDVQELVREP